MAGIERIKIVKRINGAGSWRFDVARNYLNYINNLYSYIFDLEDGSTITECSIDDKLGRYDKDFGVDVILTLKTGQTITVQEKVLTTTYKTVTVEYYQNHNAEEKGDWFKLKCDIYFVGYCSGKQDKDRRFILDRFILLDWVLVKLMHNNINWQTNINSRDGARASFKYAEFLDFPSECVLARLDKSGLYICDYLSTL